METQSVEEEIWMSLANLFFLDNEPDQYEYDAIAKFLRSSGWSKAKTEEVLVQLIAPHAGNNLGYLIYPVSGEWMCFDDAVLLPKIRKSKVLRAKYPQWYFFISDWWCKRMLRQLEVDRVLSQL